MNKDPSSEGWRGAFGGAAVRGKIYDQRANPVLVRFLFGLISDVENPYTKKT